MTRTATRHVVRSIALLAVVIGCPSFVTEAAEVPEVSSSFAAPEATRELTWIGGQAIAIGGPAAEALYADGPAR